MTNKIARFGLVALVGWKAQVVPAGALGATPPGFLDPAFGGDGRAVVAFDLGGGNVDRVEAVATQPDGKIVVVGWATTATDIDGIVARLLPDGSLDPSFSGDGKLQLALDAGGSNDDFLNAVAIQPDGKIVIVGTMSQSSDSTAVVLRLTPAGAVDTTFGSSGFVFVDHNLGGANNDEGNAIALQSDGRILVAGNSSFGPTGSAYTVARLLFDGSLDLGFDIDGRVALANNGRLAAIAAGPFGAPIYLVGSTFTGNNEWACGTYRLLWNGSLDPAWGGTGAWARNPNLGGSHNDRCFAVAIQPDLKPIFGMASTVDNANNRDFVVERDRPDGSADGTFGGSGLVQLAFDLGTNGNTDDYFQTMELQADGKLIVGGTVQADPSSSVYGLARLRADGTLDPGFGIGGKIIVSFDFQASDDDALRAVTIANDGRIVAAGTTDLSPSNVDKDFGIARLLNDLIFADGFEWEGTSRWSSQSPP